MLGLRGPLALLIPAVLLGLLFLPGQGPEPAANPPPVHIDLRREKEAIQSLSDAIRCPTVGSETASNHISNPGPFQRLHETLETHYPALWRTLTVEKVSTYSLLFTWPGSDPSLRPVMLYSHQDVVPAPPTNWTHPPFSGAVEGGFVWGRGTLDTKGSLVAILEALEQLRGSGWRPLRTVLFVAGHDEEVGGGEGAGRVAALLAARHGALELLLDEGGFVLGDGLGAGAGGCPAGCSRPRWTS
ncbi:hypothetical protein ACKKBG_A27065 [Auxenochlorella protothecoides x Auxenochlorella symbiontica]